MTPRSTGALEPTQLVQQTAQIVSGGSSGPLPPWRRLYAAVQEGDPRWILFEAAQHGRRALHSALDVDGNSLLMLCLNSVADDAVVELVRALIAQSANVATSNREGETPMHVALGRPLATARKLELARLLACHGATLNHRANDGTTPLDQALSGVGDAAPSAQLVAGLAQLGADFCRPGARGLPPLMQIMRYHPEAPLALVQTLLQAPTREPRLRCSASSEVVDDRGNPLGSPLLAAAYFVADAQVDAVADTLVRNGASLQRAYEMYSNVEKLALLTPRRKDRARSMAEVHQLLMRWLGSYRQHGMVLPPQAHPARPRRPLPPIPQQPQMTQLLPPPPIPPRPRQQAASPLAQSPAAHAARTAAASPPCQGASMPPDARPMILLRPLTPPMPPAGELTQLLASEDPLMRRQIAAAAPDIERYDLWDACRHNALEVVKVHLRVHPDAMVQPPHQSRGQRLGRLFGGERFEDAARGPLPLGLAAQHAQRSAVLMHLLEVRREHLAQRGGRRIEGVDGMLDRRDDQGMTALMWAVAGGNHRGIELLLAEGCDASLPVPAGRLGKLTRQTGRRDLVVLAIAQAQPHVVKQLVRAQQARGEEVPFAVLTQLARELGPAGEAVVRQLEKLAQPKPDAMQPRPGSPDLTQPQTRGARRAQARQEQQGPAHEAQAMAPQLVHFSEAALLKSGNSDGPLMDEPTHLLAPAPTPPLMRRAHVALKQKLQLQWLRGHTISEQSIAALTKWLRDEDFVEYDATHGFVVTTKFTANSKKLDRRGIRDHAELCKLTNADLREICTFLAEQGRPDARRARTADDSLTRQLGARLNHRS